MTRKPVDRLGPTQRLVLQMLTRQQGAMKPSEIRAQMANPENASAILRALSLRSAIAITASGWCITPLGQQLLNPPKRRAPPDQAGKVAGPRSYFTSDTYTGADLRPQQTRPAGNDALAMPSLIGGVRVPHRTYINHSEQ